MKRTNQMIKTFATLLLMMVMCVGALAQSNITITGTVKDSNGEELIGASVVVKGNTSLGTVTDFNGISNSLCLQKIRLSLSAMSAW